MFRSFRFQLLLAASASLSLLAAGAPAAGQIDPDKIDQLQQRRDEITLELAAADAEIAALEFELIDLDDMIGDRQVGIELVADEIERTVDSRREPALTRVEIAIVGFTNGDPRRNALLDEIEVLEGIEEPSQRRELYRAVIDDAQARLDAIDSQLVNLSGDLANARESLLGSEGERAAIEVAYNEAGARRSALAVELDDTQREIEFLASLENRAILTGLNTFDDPGRPVLAVKIDNVVAARPQSGINEADIVFVEEVEGGLTRFAAIFHSTGVDEVGPVRSMRTGDMDLLAQFNAPLFANSGGNRGSRAALAESTLIDIGATSHGSLYYRTGGAAPHNLYMNPFNLWSVRSGPDYLTSTPSPIFRFRDPGDAIVGNPASASGATLDYGQTIIDYDWNGTGWARTQDGSPTVDAAGQRTAPTTVIIQFTSYAISPADARSPHAITTGNGVAWILTDGQIVQANWRRNELGDQTEYVDGSGNFVAILPGRTWVEMPRTDTVTLR